MRLPRIGSRCAGAALGARTLLALPAGAVDIALGAFFVAMIPGGDGSARRVSIFASAIGPSRRRYRIRDGIVLSTGPLSVPAFTSYGLTKGAFLSTEATSSLALMISKVVAFQQLGALPMPSIIRGVVIGSSVMAGAFVGKLVVQRLSVHTFDYLLDALLLFSGTIPDLGGICSIDTSIIWTSWRWCAATAARTRNRRWRRLPT